MHTIPATEQLNTYQFHLPEELIAQSPVETRDESRLLVLHRRNGQIEHRKFRDLLDFLQPNDLLIANNSKVMKARLLGKRVVDSAGQGGGKVEFFLLKQREPLIWEGLFHASVKHRPGVRFEIPVEGKEPIIGELIEGASRSEHGTVFAKLSRDPLAEGAGSIPLPPYIGRQAWASDRSRPQDEVDYQTVYAKHLGSSAAPTAGLHFTESLLQKLKQKKVNWDEVTLHVGLGTFRPVKTENIREHQMHEESFEVPESAAVAIESTRKSGQRVFAVGTTSLRTLETAAVQGVGKVCAGKSESRLFIHPQQERIGEIPEWPFQIVDGLITNFHLPQSTLLMLVCAFGGTENVLAAYRQAVEARYRFYSYGDAMLILG